MKVQLQACCCSGKVRGQGLQQPLGSYSKVPGPFMGLCKYALVLGAGSSSNPLTGLTQLTQFFPRAIRLVTSSY